MGDITKNFSYSEYKPKGAPRDWKPESSYLDMMVIAHAQMLQVVRDEYGSGMTITSAVRSESDYYRLLEKGYFPSATSDHNFGQTMKIPDTGNSNLKKKRFWGDYYNFSVGATDVVSANVKEMYQCAVELTRRGVISPRQVIYEYHDGKDVEWLHIAGQPHLFFSGDLYDKVTEKPVFMYTTNGGRSYKVGTYGGI